MVLMQSTGLTDKQTNRQTYKQTDKQANKHVELVEWGANACDEDVVDGACMYVYIDGAYM